MREIVASVNGWHIIKNKVGAQTCWVVQAHDAEWYAIASKSFGTTKRDAIAYAEANEVPPAPVLDAATLAKRASAKAAHVAFRASLNRTSGRTS